MAVVGGSDLTKIHKQLGDSKFFLNQAIYYFKYVCTENGLVTYINTETEKLKKYYTKVRCKVKFRELTMNWERTK